MINIRRAIDNLLEDNKLYAECGELFKYLIEVKTNIRNIEYHNLSWQLAQAVDITYSKKLLDDNLNIFDVIAAYSTSNLKGTKTKKYIKTFFEVTIMASDYRRNNPELKLEIIDFIRQNLWLKLSKKNVKKLEWEKLLNQQNLKTYQSLLNGTSSNSPLYFLPIFVYMTWCILKEDKYFWIILDVLVNLYLMKNQLIFAPTLPWSYPLVYLQSDFSHTLYELESNSIAIKKLSKMIFDIIKQSSVIIRAFVSKSTLLVSDLENKIEKNKVMKNLSNSEYKDLLKVLAFDKKIFEKITKTKETEKIISELEKLNLIKIINNENNNSVYMFKDFFDSIKKLDRNKSEKTTKIFILNENLS